MSPARALKVVFALAFGASLPTIAALVYFAISGDPSFRPLGLTHEKLTAFASGSDNGVDVIVRWGNLAPNGTTPQELSDMLRRSFHGRYVAATVSVETVPGNSVDIYFRVGNSHYGPYAPSEAARGISAASAAWKYTQ